MEKTKPLTVEATLVAKKQLTNDVIELHFESSPRFHFLPGQFVSILIPGAGPAGRDLRRAYSIASWPEKANEKVHFELCVKVIEGGPGTQYLDGMKVGDRFKGMAPYGDFIYKTHAPGKHVYFVATGTGIAPFRAMIFSPEFLANPPASATLLFGARDVSDLLYTEEMEARPEVSLVHAISRPSQGFNGFKGRVTDWLRLHAGEIDWKNSDFYLCGNGAMIDEAKQIFASHGVEKSQIHQEIYYKPKAEEATPAH